MPHSVDACLFTLGHTKYYTTYKFNNTELHRYQMGFLSSLEAMHWLVQTIFL